MRWKLAARVSVSCWQKSGRALRDDELGRHVQIARGLALGCYILPDEFDLIGIQAYSLGDFGRGHLMVETIEAKIHLVVRQDEIELLLRLRQGIGVGGRRPGAYLGRNAEI